jgi:hypothetical protein
MVIALAVGSLWAAGCGGSTREENTGQDGGAGRGGTSGLGGAGRGGASGLGGASGAAGNSGGAGGAVSCPDDPLNCPAGCQLMYAQEYYLPRTCLTVESFPVGCTAMTGEPATPECFKRARDGALYVSVQVAAFRASPAWTPCTESERQLVRKSCGITCPDGQVQTVEGCLACASVHDAVATWLEQAHAKMTACNADADCTCVPTGTQCAGACSIAIATAFAADYAAEIDAVNGGYCSDPGFRVVCGFSTPRCVSCSAVCVAGKCQNL